MKTHDTAPPAPGRAQPIRHGAMLAAWALCTSAPAVAVEIDTGQSELKLRWDNTLKYSAAERVRSRDPALAPGGSSRAAIGAAVNQDDGDRNFGRGLISNRLDLLSEADLSYRGFGARVSAAAWFDAVYMRGNDNDSAGLLGPGSSTSNSERGVNQFTQGTRDLHGSRAEIQDAFVYGKFSAGDTSTTVRLGRHALVWGESLFLGSNAIAGAQNPTDIVKALSVPNTQVKEIVMPVTQLSLQSTLTPIVSVGAYYQFEYRANRLPGVGSYFSNTDIGDTGHGFAYGPGGHVPINVLPTKNSGQGGLQLRLALGETDVGFYAIRFHEKNLIPYAVIGRPPGGGAPGPTSFDISRQEGITAFGVSFSRTLGDVNLAGEASTRRKAGIPSALGADATALIPVPVPAYNTSDNPVVPIGNTAHANLSVIWSVPRTALWTTATFMAEAAWNRLLSCEKNCGLLPTTGTRDASQFVAVLSPTYNQVIPGLNVSVPVGLSYTPKGSRSLALGPGPSGPENGGSVNAGLQGLYLDAWRLGLSYTHYFGKSNIGITSDFTYAQTLKDRDFVSMSVSRTF